MGYLIIPSTDTHNDVIETVTESTICVQPQFKLEPTQQEGGANEGDLTSIGEVREHHNAFEGGWVGG